MAAGSETGGFPGLCTGKKTSGPAFTGPLVGRRGEESKVGKRSLSSLHLTYAGAVALCVGVR